jgi:transcriptional antiterminator NusG
MPKKLWYCLCVEAGKEKQIRKLITRQSRIENVKGVGRIMIPTHKEERRRSGQWVQMNIKSFPGYLIVHMHYNSDVHTLFESLERRGVYGLLPLKPRLDGFRFPRKEPKQKTPPKPWEIEVHEEWMPTALQSEEAALLLLRSKEKKVKMRPIDIECPFNIGDKVRVREGNFKDFEGEVRKTERCQDGWTVAVWVKIMGREVRLVMNSRELERAN